MKKMELINTLVDHYEDYTGAHDVLGRIAEDIQDCIEDGYIEGLEVSTMRRYHGGTYLMECVCEDGDVTVRATPQGPEFTFTLS